MLFVEHTDKLLELLHQISIVQVYFHKFSLCSLCFCVALRRGDFHNILKVPAYTNKQLSS